MPQRTCRTTHSALRVMARLPGLIARACCDAVVLVIAVKGDTLKVQNNSHTSTASRLELERLAAREEEARGARATTTLCTIRTHATPSMPRDARRITHHIKTASTVHRQRRLKKLVPSARARQCDGVATGQHTAKWIYGIHW